MDKILEFSQNPLVLKGGKFLLWIIFMVISVAFAHKQPNLRTDNTEIRYKAQKGIEVVGYVLIAFLVLISFTVKNLTDYSVIIVLFTAGIAFRFQELILGNAGSFYIFFVGVNKPGDGIEINSIKGDVIDVDSINTTLMEIGEWGSGDNYTDRIVICNAVVFKGPIKTIPWISHLSGMN